MGARGHGTGKDPEKAGELLEKVFSDFIPPGGANTSLNKTKALQGQFRKSISSWVMNFEKSRAHRRQAPVWRHRPSAAPAVSHVTLTTPLQGSDDPPQAAKKGRLREAAGAGAELGVESHLPVSRGPPFPAHAAAPCCRPRASQLGPFPGSRCS